MSLTDENPVFLSYFSMEESYRSPFRLNIPHGAIRYPDRTAEDAAPPTLLALELYIYLATYTVLKHEDVCVTMHHIMEDIDWEMLAIMDEARSLDVPNIYDAEDNVEEEDLWTRIRGLPEHAIFDNFKDLMNRFRNMGFNVSGIIRKQVGRRTFAVLWDDQGIPIEVQPMIRSSRFDIDYYAGINDCVTQGQLRTKRFKYF